MLDVLIVTVVVLILVGVALISTFRHFNKGKN
jgi:hypothetical protein